MTKVLELPKPDASDEELEDFLAAREKQEEEAVLELAKKGLKGESPCPVCGAPLEEATPPGWLKPLVAGGDLSCDACEFKAQAAPSVIALWGVRPVVAALLLYAAVTKIFEAQRIMNAGDQFFAFGIGFAIFGAAAAVWYSVGGAASPKLLQARILGARRRHEDKQAGVVAPKVGGGFGEQLEAIVVAVILALIIRHFVMEAFVIPTGSMAPTLLGDHFEMTCELCAHEFPVSKTETELTPRSEIQFVEPSATCPLCRREQTARKGRADVVGGHKILVNKFVYAFRDPKRYEVVVFKKPGEPDRNYIKRLVGLPGETLRIVNGDLFTVDDQGRAQRARRPDSIQDAIWIPFHDAGFARDSEQQRPPWWRAEGEGLGAWQFGQDGKLDTDGLWMKCTPKGKAPAWAGFLTSIRTQYGYARHDLGQGYSDRATSDARVRVFVTGEEGGQVRLAIRESSPGDGGQTRRVVAGVFPIGASGGDYAIEVDGKVQHSVKASPLAPGKKHEVTLAYADDRARLQVDGRTVLTWEDPYGPETTSEAEVLIAGSNKPVLFERTRIDRDIHYIPHSGGDYDPSQQDVTIPKNAYYCLGDNSPNSLDGRAWGFVHEGYMIGRAFMIFWPAKPKHLRLIR